MAPDFQLPDFPIDDAAADPAAVVRCGSARFTVLSSRLLRCEYDSEQRFEDRPTQLAWHRRLPAPTYSVDELGDGIDLCTEHLLLRYRPGDHAFDRDALRITAHAGDIAWRCGDTDEGTLIGSAASLDHGAGLISRRGWSVLHDLPGMVLDDGVWRAREPAGQDLYFFGHGRDHAGCLRDFYRLSGHPPLIPKAALGLWWSASQRARQDGIEDLVGAFRAIGLPLGVCALDCGEQFGDGASSWNRVRFPDPPGLAARLHRQGVQLCLALASPATATSDDEFAAVLEDRFRVQLPQLKRDGVDLFGIAGNQRRELAGLQRRWILIHHHAADRVADGRRPLLLARWGGIGAHRSPVACSGEAQRSWRTLRHQVFTTANSANVGFGWWSHALGGSGRGVADPERLLRWLQFGCFSPVLRLHDDGAPGFDQRPWLLPEPYREAAHAILHLRRQLLPYLYGAAWRHHHGAAPVATPMYWGWPDREEAYLVPQQYRFGDDLIVAPMTTPIRRQTGLARQLLWLPEGRWFAFASGRCVSGPRWLAAHGGLNEVPVYARAGAIVPLAGEHGQDLELLCFPGADGSVEIYDDGGEGFGYRNGDYGLLCVEARWQDTDLNLTVTHQSGERRLERRVQLRLRGLVAPEIIRLRFDGRELDVDEMVLCDGDDLVIGGLRCRGGEVIEISFAEPPRLRPRMEAALLGSLLSRFRLDSFTQERLLPRVEAMLDDLRSAAPLLVDFDAEQRRTLVELVADAGVATRRLPDGRDLIAWWGERQKAATSGLIAERSQDGYRERWIGAEGGSAYHVSDPRPPWSSWWALVHFAGVAAVELRCPDPCDGDDVDEVLD